MEEERLSASDHILRGLYEGRYVAGQRLVKPDPVSRYAVSRSTVREAIRSPAAQGVVEARHDRGARIRQFTRREARNVLLITEAVVGLAARLAAHHLGDEGARATFEAAHEALMKASAQSDKFEFARARFHRTMARISANPELERMLATLQVHLVRNRLVMRPGPRPLVAHAVHPVCGARPQQPRLLDEDARPRHPLARHALLGHGHPEGHAPGGAQAHPPERPPGQADQPHAVVDAPGPRPGAWWRGARARRGRPPRRRGPASRRGRTPGANAPPPRRARPGARGSCSAGGRARPRGRSCL